MILEIRDEEVIIAQCTPSGNGALALLRLSGKNTFCIANKIAQLPSKKSISQVPTHTIHYGYVIDEQQKHIDQVLFLVMHGPQTFTGQDTVEITCHNNPFIVEAIINQVIQHGARLAEPGEFTKRAFLNKKIDLAQAEALNELIHAHTQKALEQSLAQLEGSLSQWITIIEEELIQAISLCEASFEFLEDTVNFDDQIRTIISTLLEKITHIANQEDHQQHIKEGIRIALIGSVNAGKSSLFNKLLKKERAIVTEIPGTTRDVIEAGIYRYQSYITLVDTAGIRQTDELIEKEGIKRSFEEAARADIILLIIDNSKALSNQEAEQYNLLRNNFKEKIITVATKNDLKQKDSLLDNAAIAVSNKTGQGIEILETTISAKINTLLQTSSAYLLTKRQYHLLHQLKKDLSQITSMISETVEYELVSIHLHDTLEKLILLTGKDITDRSINQIFERFCIGK